jgi:hypothetical protein
VTKVVVASVVCERVKFGVRDHCIAQQHATEFSNHAYRYVPVLCRDCAALIDALSIEIRAVLTPRDTCVHDQPCKNGRHSARCADRRRTPSRVHPDEVPE